MIYKGGCHCGNIKFEAEGDLAQVIECNCSICSKRASLLWFIPRQQFRLSAPQVEPGTYTFNKHKIKHHFCTVCGCAPFSEANDEKGNAMAAINARCLEDTDLSLLKVIPFNGRSL